MRYFLPFSLFLPFSIIHFVVHEFQIKKGADFYHTGLPLSAHLYHFHLFIIVFITVIHHYLYHIYPSLSPISKYIVTPYTSPLFIILFILINHPVHHYRHPRYLNPLSSSCSKGSGTMLMSRRQIYHHNELFVQRGRHQGGDPLNAAVVLCLTVW